MKPNKISTINVTSTSSFDEVWELIKPTSPNDSHDLRYQIARYVAYGEPVGVLTTTEVEEVLGLFLDLMKDFGGLLKDLNRLRALNGPYSD